MSYLGFCVFAARAIFHRQSAVPVSGEIKRQRPFGRLPDRLIAEMSDHHSHSPVVGQRMIEVIAPDYTVQLRLSISRAQGQLERRVEADELVQAVQRPLNDHVSTTHERSFPEFVALEYAVIVYVPQIDQRAF